MSAGCQEAQSVFPVRFVWASATDNPAGGLDGHELPDASSAVVESFRWNAVVAVTGECFVGNNGETWHLLQGSQSGVWVRAWQLSPVPGPACRLDGENSIDGLAVASGERVAFFDFDPQQGFPPEADQSYEWQLATDVEFRQCYGSTSPGPLCLLGDITLTDPLQSAAVWNGMGPADSAKTGVTYPGRSSAAEAIQVTLTDDTGTTHTGFVDPFDILTVEGRCP